MPADADYKTPSIHAQVIDQDLEQHFTDLVSRSVEEIALDEAALTIARVVYPDLRVRDYLDRIDRIAETVAARIQDQTDSLKLLVLMQQVLFQEQGLRGNQEDYYDPRNSYINDVLDRHIGIPISLAVIYLAVADRLGLPVSGISFPGHFLLRWQLEQGQVIVDVFNGGTTLGAEEITRLAEGALGKPLSDPVVATRFLVPCDRRQILARMLRNLEALKGRDEDDEVAQHQRLAFLNLCLIADPDSRMQLSNRATVLTRLDCHGAAISDLERLIQLTDSESAEIAVTEERLHALRLQAPSMH